MSGATAAAARLVRGASGQCPCGWSPWRHCGLV